MAIKRRHLLVGAGGLGLALLSEPLKTALVGRSTDSATAAADPLLRFVAVADTGTGADGQYQVAKAMSQWHTHHPYQFVTLAGDNIYNNGEMEKIEAVFERPYQPLLKAGVKFYACLGNHDVRTSNGTAQIGYAGFHMGDRYYTFTRGPAQFFVLDTNLGAHWQPQLTWLKQQLQASKAAWKIVYGHHPVYSSGLYGVNKTLVKDFTPLFKQHRVQLYLNGHEHDYERTQSINGTTYLICGAGASTRPVGRSRWTAHSASRLSFALIEVYPQQITIRGIGTDGKVFDQGNLQRA
jgi:hypothetical protein